MRLPLLVCMALLCLYSSKATAQENPGLVEKISNFPTKFLDKLYKKANDLEEKVFVQPEKILNRHEIHDTDRSIEIRYGG